MKKTFTYIILGAIILMAYTSCKKNDYILYDTSQKDAIFFEWDQSNDSINFNFGFYTITDSTFKIQVNLMGMPKDSPRTINISLYNEKYATEDVPAASDSYFEIPETVTLEADSIRAWIPVKILRHADLETKRVILTINIEESEDFRIAGYSEYTITFDDLEPDMPAWWSTYSLGYFSKFKGQLFFTYFKEMEQENPYLYNLIVSQWGEFIDRKPPGQSSWATSVYYDAFTVYVYYKMYQYSLEHPELDLQIPEVTI